VSRRGERRVKSRLLMPCAAAAAEAKVSSCFFYKRRICAPIAVYDERGRAVLLCRAPLAVYNERGRAVLLCWY
jgi:hypothetical protein